jgi:hypothetical protein
VVEVSQTDYEKILRPIIDILLFNEDLLVLDLDLHLKGSIDFLLLVLVRRLIRALSLRSDASKVTTCAVSPVYDSRVGSNAVLYD